jgi:hypothetical protein
MRAKNWLLVSSFGAIALALLGGAVAIVGCGTSDRFADGGVDGGPDAGDGAVADSGEPSSTLFGDPCTRASDCGRGLFCDMEVDLSYPARGLPPGEEVLASAFPGGVCTPVPAAPYDPEGLSSCDPLAPVTHQGCGRRGVCVEVSLEDESVMACREQCEPQADASGCERRFYTCDFDQGACIEGCQTDEECQLELVDTNADGAPDALALDADSRAQCDLSTYRCTHPGSGSAAIGEPCERLDDCEPDGTCVQPLQTFAGHPFPGGTCTKVGCEVEGRECSGDDVACARLRPWTPGFITAHACFPTCTVGAEPEGDRIGPEGHGEGCRPGYRCHYNGGSGAESGVCVGGNYNAVTDNNLGAACEADAECYSPYGQGSCLLLSVADVRAPVGTCSIMDCNAPGLADDVCGPNGTCIGLAGDITFCAQTCKDATECAEGYACSDDDADPTTSSICYPACSADAECRKDEEVCALSAASGVGACVASGT